MKKALTSVALALALLAPQTVLAQWISHAQYCRVMESISDLKCGPMPVTSKGVLIYWGGTIVEHEIDDDGHITKMRKVKVTWVSDDTDYRCGQILTFHDDELKDFTHRSLNMRPCK